MNETKILVTAWFIARHIHKGWDWLLQEMIIDVKDPI